MAVLVEAISVIVRRKAVNTRFSDGWRGFLACVSNSSLCTDEDLVRVGFMSPPDIEEFIRHLERSGLTFLHNGQSVDIAVVDQMRGPTMPVEWLEFARISFDETGNKVSACWLFEGPRFGAGIHMPAKGITLATPEGWSYEDSLSANFKFIENEEMQEKLKFLRREQGTDVYLDLATGKEVFVSGGRGKLDRFSIGIMKALRRLRVFHGAAAGPSQARGERRGGKPNAHAANSNGGSVAQYV